MFVLTFQTLGVVVTVSTSNLWNGFAGWVVTVWRVAASYHYGGEGRVTECVNDAIGNINNWTDSLTVYISHGEKKTCILYFHLHKRVPMDTTSNLNHILVEGSDNPMGHDLCVWCYVQVNEKNIEEVCSIPLTVRAAEASSLPTRFSATQVNMPSSLIEAFFTLRT